MQKCGDGTETYSKKCFQQWQHGWAKCIAVLKGDPSPFSKR